MKAFASGRWLVTEGNEEEFLKRWTEFLRRSKEEAPGFIEAHLLRDTENPRGFISLSEWTDAEARQAWKQQPDFRSHLDAARNQCDEFFASDYELATEVK